VGGGRRRGRLRARILAVVTREELDRGLWPRVGGERARRRGDAVHRGRRVSGASVPGAAPGDRGDPRLLGAGDRHPGGRPGPLRSADRLGRESGGRVVDDHARRGRGGHDPRLPAPPLRPRRPLRRAPGVLARRAGPPRTTHRLGAARQLAGAKQAAERSKSCRVKIPPCPEGPCPGARHQDVSLRDAWRARRCPRRRRTGACRTSRSRRGPRSQPPRATNATRLATSRRGPSSSRRRRREPRA
jgi:hypothetical protein